MNLRKYFEETGVKQAFFAEKIGVSPQSIQGWMTKGKIPKLETLLKIEEQTKGQVKIKDWVN